MSETKYDSVYCEVDLPNECHQLLDGTAATVDIAAYFKNHKKELSCFSDKFMCPGCSVARLALKHSVNDLVFFSRNKNSPHAEGCYYNLPKATGEESTSYYSNLNDKQIESKLESSIRQLRKGFADQQPTLVSNDDAETREDDEPAEIITVNHRERKTVRKLSLRTFINKKDFKELDGQIVVFYGTCSLSLSKVRPYSPKKNEKPVLFYQSIQAGLSGVKWFKEFSTSEKNEPVFADLNFPIMSSQDVKVRDVQDDYIAVFICRVKFSSNREYPNLYLLKNGSFRFESL